MTEIFLDVINMSISASYAVLAVLLLRLFFGKAPKWMMVALWGVVGLRLLCPFSIQSVLSLIPSAKTLSPSIMTSQIPVIHSGIEVLNRAVNPVISESFRPMPGDSANPLQVWIPVLATVWIVGMVTLIVYAVVSYARVKQKIGTAVLLRENICQSENVASPFVLGLVKPKIYLPFGMEEGHLIHVVAHEQTHIQRKDHLWKPLGFLLLAIHWFNPLVWIGYIMLSRDIELACDEKVIKDLDCDARAAYSQALLSCSINRRMIAACPLAFGEVGVKDRVKAVLHYRKPALWIMFGAVVACVAVAVCFLTNPKDRYYGETDVNKLSYEQLSLTEQYPEYFGLDATEGLDVYVWQMAKNSYSFALLPHQDGKFGFEDLLHIRGTDAKQMRQILATYDMEKTYVRIVLWQNPLSSYISEWQIIGEGIDPEAKKREYTEKIFQMLFGEEEILDAEKQKSDAVLLYSDPTYNWVSDDIPKVTVKENMLYGINDGAYYSSKLSEVTITKSTISQLRTKYGGRYSVIADELEENNDAIYENTEMSPMFSGVGIYYVLIQKNGDVILVYGHYEKGEKTGLIRWIYNVGQ